MIERGDLPARPDRGHRAGRDRALRRAGERLRGRGVAARTRRCSLSACPVLGICYGMQLMAHLLGGAVSPSERREYGLAELEVVASAPLFAGTPARQRVWMSHGDTVTAASGRVSRSSADTDSTPVAAMADRRAALRRRCSSTPRSATPSTARRCSSSFLELVGARRDWTPARDPPRVGGRPARGAAARAGSSAALSGGVDSTVTAMLLREAIGERTGADLRRHRAAAPGRGRRGCERRLPGSGMRDRPRRRRGALPSALAGVADPGAEAARSSATSSSRSSRPRRGASRTPASSPRARSTPTSSSPRRCAGRRRRSRRTTTSAGCRSGWVSSSSSRCATCSRTRCAGSARSSGCRDEFVWRHPFPGPGLAVRILGDGHAGAGRDCSSEADAIFIEEIRAAGLYREIAQALCGAAAGAQRRGDGRPADLRERRWPSGP